MRQRLPGLLALAAFLVGVASALAQDGSSGVRASAIVLANEDGAKVYAVVTQGRTYLDDAELFVNEEPLAFGQPFVFDGAEAGVLPVYHLDLGARLRPGDLVSFTAKRGGKTIYERKDVPLPGYVKILPVARSPWDPRLERARWTPVEGAEDYLVDRTSDPEDALQVLAAAGDVDLLSVEPPTSFFVAATFDRQAGTGTPVPEPRTVRASDEPLRLNPAPDETHGDIRYRMSKNDPSQITSDGTVYITMKLKSGYSAAFIRVERPGGGIAYFWKEINLGGSKEYRVTFPVKAGGGIWIGRYHADWLNPIYRK